MYTQEEIKKAVQDTLKQAEDCLVDEHYKGACDYYLFAIGLLQGRASVGDLPLVQVIHSLAQDACEIAFSIEPTSDVGYIRGLLNQICELTKTK